MPPPREIKRTKKVTTPQLPPGVRDNPFAELLSMMLFIGAEDDCDCRLCQMVRKAKDKMAESYLKGGKF